MTTKNDFKTQLAKLKNELDEMTVLFDFIERHFYDLKNEIKSLQNNLNDTEDLHK